MVSFSANRDKEELTAYPPLSNSNRRDLFNETAARMGLPATLIEKDFWVCWILKQLFTIKGFDGWFVFKGGTSLTPTPKVFTRKKYHNLL